MKMGFYLPIYHCAEKIQKWYYTALEFCARRRQASQAKQTLTVVISIQLAPSYPEKSGERNSNAR